MENNDIGGVQDKELAELYSDSQQWKSQLRLMADELLFIKRLLNSYVFEPNTPNLFERLQGYQDRLKQIHNQRIVVRGHITRHENDLGGILECTDRACSLEYYKKHGHLSNEAADCLLDFQNLKSEIFNYAGGILKGRKPRK